MRYLALLLAFILLVGCQIRQPFDLGFTTDQDRYAPGSEVQLQLENQTEQTIGYNLCFSELQQQTGGEWQLVEGSEEVCTAIQNGLEPGDQATYTKTLPADLPAGTYRYETDVTYRDTEEREPLATEPFSVES